MTFILTINNTYSTQQKNVSWFFLLISISFNFHQHATSKQIRYHKKKISLKYKQMLIQYNFFYISNSIIQRLVIYKKNANLPLIIFNTHIILIFLRILVFKMKFIYGVIPKNVYLSFQCTNNFSLISSELLLN